MNCMYKFDDRFVAASFVKKTLKESNYNSYCYMLTDDNWIPFYVGIASNYDRLHSHIRMKNENNLFKNNKILKIGKENVRFVIIRFFHGWIEACHAERSLIIFYGKRINNTGLLTNVSDGGDGTLGYTFSEKQKQATRERSTGKKHSPETLKRLSELVKGDKHPMYGIKGENHHSFGKPLSLAIREKISKTKQNQKLICTDKRKEQIKQYWENQPILVCPHCNKESHYKAPMIAYHFDNCKKKPASALN